MAINSSPRVLVSRNINCANVTKDDFVNAIVEDMKNAYQKHIAHNQPIVDKRNEEYVNSQINKITEFANSKYKLFINLNYFIIFAKISQLLIC